MTNGTAAWTFATEHLQQLMETSSNINSNFEFQKLLTLGLLAGFFLFDTLMDPQLVDLIKKSTKIVFLISSQAKCL